jgi:recombination protein RecR
MAYKYPETLNTLISHLKKLPGIGTRTAERFAFELIRWKPKELQEIGDLLYDLPSKIIPCATCGCLTQENTCHFCIQRDTSSLCILSSTRDVYAMEETKSYRGLYHVIEHLLSPLDGRHTKSLRIERIEKRIEEQRIKEVILAFDSTLEGDTTALYLKEKLSKYSLSISRLAFGLPVGSTIEYTDSGTLARALSGRQSI